MVIGTLSVAKAVAKTYLNRDAVEASDVCGCYSCFSLFAPNKIKLWVDSIDPNDEEPGALRDTNHRYRGLTAICPHSGESSTIGSASGVAVTHSRLKEMSAYWHGRSYPAGS